MILVACIQLFGNQTDTRLYFSLDDAKKVNVLAAYILYAKEAVRLLSDPDNQTPLKAISAELGFNSMTTFYSQFQAATGEFISIIF